MNNPKPTQKQQHLDFTMFRISIKQIFPHRKPLVISTATRAEVLSDSARGTTMQHKYFGEKSHNTYCVNKFQTETHGVYTWESKDSRKPSLVKKDSYAYLCFLSLFLMTKRKNQLPVPKRESIPTWWNITYSETEEMIMTRETIMTSRKIRI